MHKPVHFLVTKRAKKATKLNNFVFAAAEKNPAQLLTSMTSDSIQLCVLK